MAKRMQNKGLLIGTSEWQSSSFTSKALLLLLSVGYASYAFSLGGVRESLGVSPVGGDPAIDIVQKVIAVLCVIGMSIILVLPE